MATPGRGDAVMKAPPQDRPHAHAHARRGSPVWTDGGLDLGLIGQARFLSFRWERLREVAVRMRGEDTRGAQEAGLAAGWAAPRPVGAGPALPRPGLSYSSPGGEKAQRMASEAGVWGVNKLKSTLWGPRGGGAWFRGANKRGGERSFAVEGGPVPAEQGHCVRRQLRGGDSMCPGPGAAAKCGPRSPTERNGF